ncbi:MAG: hypothetical protein AAFQ65_12695 [Myxococcota bacterium]
MSMRVEPQPASAPLSTESASSAVRTVSHSPASPVGDDVYQPTISASQLPETHPSFSTPLQESSPLFGNTTRLEVGDALMNTIRQVTGTMHYSFDDPGFNAVMNEAYAAVRESGTARDVAIAQRSLAATARATDVLTEPSTNPFVSFFLGPFSGLVGAGVAFASALVLPLASPLGLLAVGLGLAVALIAFIRTARLHIQRSSAKREAREAYTDLLLRQQELRRTTHRGPVELQPGISRLSLQQPDARASAA